MCLFQEMSGGGQAVSLVIGTLFATGEASTLALSRAEPATRSATPKHRLSGVALSSNTQPFVGCMSEPSTLLLLGLGSLALLRKRRKISP